MTSFYYFCWKRVR